MAAPVPFHVDLTDLARPVVTIAGQDVSQHVAGLALEVETGRTVPLLQLTLHAVGSLEGIAQLEQAPAPGDMLHQLARLLEQLDPLELEQAALNDPDLPNEPGAVTAGALREAARLLRAGA